jgi:hypothetical protein
LRRIAPALRKLGYTVVFGRAGDAAGTRIITIDTALSYAAGSADKANDRQNRQNRQKTRQSADPGLTVENPPTRPPSETLRNSPPTVGERQNPPRRCAAENLNFTARSDGSDDRIPTQTNAGNKRERANGLACDLAGCMHKACSTGPGGNWCAWHLTPWQRYTDQRPAAASPVNDTGKTAVCPACGCACPEHELICTDDGEVACAACRAG